MKKEDIPPITATNFDQAQAFVREYSLGQFRVSEYIKALAILPTQGKFPTDASIAKLIDENRTKQSARPVMLKLIRIGIARELHETEKCGFAYDMTDKGEQAYTKLRQVERNWLAKWQAQLEPERPDYSVWFEKKNRELKELRAEKERTTEELRADKEQLAGTIATQQRLIESQDSEIRRLKAECERLSKVAGEGSNRDRIPYPL